MFMTHSRPKINKLNKEPETPNIYWLISISLASGFITLKTIDEGWLPLLKILVLTLSVFLIASIRWAFCCHRNKCSLYKEFESLEIEFHELEKTFKSQVKLREKTEDELHTLQSEQYKYVIEQTIQQIMQQQQVAATNSSGKQRKDG